MKKTKLFVQKIIVGANVATIFIMLLVGFSDRISPATHPLIAVVGLTFPFFIVLNLLFLIFWVIVKPIKTIIPIAGFLVCFVPIRIYSPLNMSQEVPADAIKLISYNVLSFAEWSDENEPSAIIDYLKEQDADIVCLQECDINYKKQDVFNKEMSTLYKYIERSQSASGGDKMIVCSKFPIIGRDTIRYESSSNHSMAYKLNMHGDTVLFIVNHLESTKLTAEEKQNFNTMVVGKMDKQTARTESHLLVSKIAKVAARRAPQADSIAKYIDEHKEQSILLCGDFNDNPISYTRRTIAKKLTDCYVATGNGPGISYNSSKMYVRIDNIMCSSDWTPCHCYVDNSIKASDHYPIVCQLKLNKETIK